METNRVIEFECSCVVGDELWFSARDFNGLFKGNLKNGEVNFVAFFPDEPFIMLHMHEQIIRHENKLYFITGVVTHFHVYDMKTGEIKAYKIQGTVMEKSYRACINAGNLYFIPRRVPEMIIFHPEKEEISYQDLQLKDSMQRNIAHQEGKVYGTLENNNVIVEINLGHNKVRQISVGETGNQYLILGMRQNILYLRNNSSNEIILWNTKTEKITARHIMKASIFIDALQLEDRVMVNTFLGNGVQEINLDKVKCNIYRKEMDETVEIPLSPYELLNMFAYQDELWYVWGGDGAIYNGNTHQHLVKFMMNHKILEQMRKKAIERNDIVNNETNFFSIVEYAKWLEKNV